MIASFIYIERQKSPHSVIFCVKSAFYPIETTIFALRNVTPLIFS